MSPLWMADPPREGDRDVDSDSVLIFVYTTGMRGAFLA